MTVNLDDYKLDIQSAIKAFWTSRASASRKQKDSGTVDQGERASVIAGHNMDGFFKLVKKIVCLNGLPHANIHMERRVLTLPGYFRPTKLWDVLVTFEGRLIVAVEFKSQVGPSFGNNFNNRTEEAIGTAVDLWTAYREGAFGDIQRPFVGWFMLVEDCDASRKPVKDQSPHFPVLPDFHEKSYSGRYDILCKKLVKEQLYAARWCYHLV